MRPTPRPGPASGAPAATGFGVVAGGTMRVTTADPPYWWEAHGGVFVDGLLHVRGRGYSSRAAHCCPQRG